jgi:integrase
MLKETAMRCGEAWALHWTDIDFEASTVTVNNPEKHGNPRMLKISSKLVTMLNELPKDSFLVFGGKSLRVFRANYMLQRKRLAQKLGNPRLAKISFHTFRHWKASMEYHRTKDILHVKQMLGHKRIENTMVYTQVISFESDEFHVRTAESVRETCELVEAGFEYVTDMDGLKVFRKRK